MIFWILSKLFPPRASKLGKIDNVNASLLLHSIREGLVRVEKNDVREAGTGRVFEWGDGLSKKPTRVWRTEIVTL